MCRRPSILVLATLLIVCQKPQPYVFTCRDHPIPNYPRPPNFGTAYTLSAHLFAIGKFASLCYHVEVARVF